MYGHPLCRLCVLGDSGWLAWAGGHRALCAGAKLGMCWGDPETLCTEGTLTGQLKLKCVQSRALQAEDVLVEQLELSQASVRRSWSARSQSCPSMPSGAEVVQAWSVPMCLAPVSPWYDD